LRGTTGIFARVALIRQSASESEIKAI
jgi:hypothetical protein